MALVRTSASILVLWVAATCSGADLDKLRTPPRKEPTYKSGAPRYCLLVFGEDAKVRVWLVLDGPDLHVDRNGNGDLTNPGERIAATRDETFAKFDNFDAGDLADGKRIHRGLTIVRFGRESSNAKISVNVAGLGSQTADVDAAGDLAFAARAQDAPVIHFGGPLTVVLKSNATYRPGAKAKDLTAVVGSPGSGPGTFAALSYDDIPDEGHPVAEIELPNKAHPKRIETIRVSLTRRC